MNINEQAKKAEKKIVANYVYKNDLCIRRLIQKKCIEEFLQNINVFKTNLIRLGNDGDGGYLVPDDLNGIEACFSPGVAGNVNFEKALALDPTGAFVPDAKRRMVYINNTVAKHYYEIAYFYFKRGAYNAAIDRAAQVVRDYPQSESTEDALVLTIRAYKTLGLNDQAEANISVLRKNYPKNKYLVNMRADGTVPSMFDRLFGWF